MTRRGCRAGDVSPAALFGLRAAAETAWMPDAVCRGTVDPELFFPVSEVGPGVRQVIEAKAVCARCPVRSACLAFALDRDVDGVWGGTTQGERRTLRKPDRRVA